MIICIERKSRPSCLGRTAGVLVPSIAPDIKLPMTIGADLGLSSWTPFEVAHPLAAGDRS